MHITPVVYITLTPKAQIDRAFGDVLPKWGGPGNSQPGIPTGEERARAVLARLDAAFDKLGKRTGERANVVRSWLTSRRDSLRASLDAYESLGVERDEYCRVTAMGGAIVREHLARQTAAREATAAASRAFEVADPDDIRAARDAVDRAEAMQRKADRELGALVSAVAFPELPDLRAFERAESDTDYLLRAMRGGAQRRAITLHEALDQGRDASDGVAMLWACFETKSHEAFDLRWERYREQSLAANVDAPAHVSEAAAS